MSFNSIHFVAFMVAMLALTALTSRSVKARNSLLLVASYYFYGE